MNTSEMYTKMTEVGYFQHVSNVIKNPDTHFFCFDTADNAISVFQSNGIGPHSCFSFDLDKYERGKKLSNKGGFKTSEQRYLFFQRLKRKAKVK